VRWWHAPYGFSGLPFRQRDWGLRLGSGDNRLAPIGPGYSKNVCLSDKVRSHGGGVRNLQKIWMKGRHIPEVPTALHLFLLFYLGYRGLKPPSP
jgi:hypothetical protein